MSDVPFGQLIFTPAAWTPDMRADCVLPCDVFARSLVPATLLGRPVIPCDMPAVSIKYGTLDDYANARIPVTLPNGTTWMPARLWRREYKRLLRGHCARTRVRDAHGRLPKLRRGKR